MGNFDDDFGTDDHDTFELNALAADNACDAHEYESACRYCGAPDGVACLPGCREGAEDDGDSCESLGLRGAL
jgi:hypothetical protein